MNDDSNCRNVKVFVMTKAALPLVRATAPTQGDSGIVSGNGNISQNWRLPVQRVGTCRPSPEPNLSQPDSNLPIESVQLQWYVAGVAAAQA